MKVRKIKVRDRTVSCDDLELMVGHLTKATGVIAR